MPQVKSIKAREIMDSRGNPTIEVDVTLNDGSMGRAAVPSGASTGSLEALELRDLNNKRFNGKGVLKAIENVDTLIAPHLIGIDLERNSQIIIDKILIELDNSENKAHLGANAILGVSLAMAKARAISLNMPLYHQLNEDAYLLPIPMMNIINGGAHADNFLDIQEFMIMPFAATSIKEAIRMGAEIFHSLKGNLARKFYNTNVGDEGGFAPNLKNSQEALDFILLAIEEVGLKAGSEIKLALDAASSEFFNKDKLYDLKGEGKLLSSAELIDYYKLLIKDYPIYSIEDPMAENDYTGWQHITQQLGSLVQLVADDLFVTNPKLIRQGIEDNLANAVLIKPNQIGTLTETLEAVDIAHQAKYKTIISHRSGETEDTTIAHLAVATNCGQIKTGSLSRSDRVAKYNELIRIEEMLGSTARYASNL